MALLLLTASLCATASASSSASSCHIFPGATLGQKQISTVHAADAGACCDTCTANDKCQAWTFHKHPPPGTTNNCFLKDNVKPLDPPRPVDPHNNTMSGLTSGGTCTPHATPVDLCPQGYPCPDCGAPVCSCVTKGPVPQSPFGCLPPHDKLPFCDKVRFTSF